MITPQDIREKTFEKAVFGGYDMAAIDAYLEEIANDIALLQKENQVLKGKMKVLVDKVEEYRGNEDALRLAVISAQRLATSIEREAREKAEGIIAEANAEAERITAEASLALQLEEAKLAEAKRYSAKFISSMNLLCNKQMAFLQKVGEMDFVKEMNETPAAEEPAAPVAAPKAEMHETVKSIEETVSKVADVPEQTIVPDIPAPQPAFDAAPTRAYGIVSNEAMGSTAQFSFDTLGDE